MASTRNKNNRGDYQVEQKSHIQRMEYLTYENGGNGKPLETFFAGNGLLSGRVASSNLSHNSCDIESSLLGIGSTNLVNPQTPVKPDIKPLQSLNVIDKLPTMIPEPLIIDKHQRPLRD